MSSSSSTGLADVEWSSSTPVAAYLIETSLFEAVAAVSWLLAVLLLLSSLPRVSAQPVASSKRFFHAVVTLCASLNLVKSVDNQQVFRRFASDAYIVIFLTNNITPSLMLGGAVLIYNTIDVQYRISKSHTPRLLAILLAGLSASNFVVINTLTILAVVRLQQRYFLYLVWWLVGSFAVLLVIADISVANVRSLVLKYQRRAMQGATHTGAATAAVGTGTGAAATVAGVSSPVQPSRAASKMVAAEKSLYPLYGFVAFLNILLALVIAALIYQGVTILSEGLQYTAPNRADPRSWEVDLFAWVHVAVIWLFFWWSWVPLVVLHRCLRRVGLVVGASASEAGVQQLIQGKDSGTDGHGGAISAATQRATTTTMHSAAGAGGANTGNGTARGYHHAQSNGQILVQPRNGGNLDSARGNGNGNGNGNGLNSARGSNGLGSARGNGTARGYTKPGEVISSARGSGSMGRVYERGLAATGRQAIGSPGRPTNGGGNGNGLTPRTGDTLGPPPSPLMGHTAGAHTDSTLLLTPSPRTGGGLRSSSDAAPILPAKDASPSSTLLPGQSGAGVLMGSHGSSGGGGGAHSTTEKDSHLGSAGHGPPDVNRALSVNVSSKNNHSQASNHGGSARASLGSGAGGAGNATTLVPNPKADARFSVRHSNDVTEHSVSREGEADADRPGAGGGGRLSERNSPVHGPASPTPVPARAELARLVSSSPLSASAAAVSSSPVSAFVSPSAASSPAASPAAAAAAAAAASSGLNVPSPHSPSHKRGAGAGSGAGTGFGSGSHGGGGGGLGGGGGNTRGTASVSAVHLESAAQHQHQHQPQPQLPGSPSVNQSSGGGHKPKGSR